jgi:hypothetical protein
LLKSERHKPNGKRSKLYVDDGVDKNYERADGEYEQMIDRATKIVSGSASGV